MHAFFGLLWTFITLTRFPKLSFRPCLDQGFREGKGKGKGKGRGSNVPYNWIL